MRKLITAAVTNENNIYGQGYRFITGLDEAGRGAWAGPVSAAAVCLPVGDPQLTQKLAGVRDSKKMTARQRHKLVEVIKEVAIAWGIGWATCAEIDEMNILRASCLAMVRAFEAAQTRNPAFQPDFLLVDSIKCPELVAKNVPFLPIIKGDQVCLSIAAASVVAKTWRDDYMRQLDETLPHYAFGAHKGYGTQKHQNALKIHGASAHHRMTFAPLRRLSENA